MSDTVLRELRDLIQVDVNRRGLATDPEANLINTCPDDFAAACRSIAETPDAGLCVVTGFYIADADPPAGETDGPLGALFLARALTPHDIQVSLATDHYCADALSAAVEWIGLGSQVQIVRPQHLMGLGFDLHIELFLTRHLLGWPEGRLTHLIALERAGPAQDGCCYNMRGREMTQHVEPAHVYFEPKYRSLYPPMTTIGIGDGGNEIGMGKIPREVIARNIPRGDLIACRVPTDYLIVCGVSNWGAYALAAGVAHLRGVKLDPSLFDVEKERELLRVMVESGPLVDGVTGRPTVSVDGLPFDEYIKPLLRIKEILGY